MDFAPKSWDFNPKSQIFDLKSLGWTQPWSYPKTPESFAPKIPGFLPKTSGVSPRIPRFAQNPRFSPRNATLRWKCSTMIISPSQGWNTACLMLLYRMSTLSPRTDVKRNPGRREKKTPKTHEIHPKIHGSPKDPRETLKKLQETSKSQKKKTPQEMLKTVKKLPRNRQETAEEPWGSS